MIFLFISRFMLIISLLFLLWAKHFPSFFFSQSLIVKIKTPLSFNRLREPFLTSNNGADINHHENIFTRFCRSFVHAFNIVGKLTVQAREGVLYLPGLLVLALSYYKRNGKSFLLTKICYLFY